MPHHQARIRFALDNRTWRRLQGQECGVPAAGMGNLSEAEATEVWASRLQSAVNILALKFHMIYGGPCNPKCCHVAPSSFGIAPSRVQPNLTLLNGRLHELVESKHLRSAGEPRAVYVLGGNAVRCHGLVTTAR